MTALLVLLGLSIALNVWLVVSLRALTRTSREIVRLSRTVDAMGRPWKRG